MSVGQVLGPVQLRLDPVLEMAEIDAAIRVRRPRSRPGLHRLLNERREAMRALAAQLRPE
jgi:hypothetical protein